MKKIKILVNNIFIYGFGGIIGRIVPFIMLPIVTRMMPNSSYYGLNDLSLTITSVGQAIAVFGMYDAMFRLFFDKEDKEYQKQICSTALAITLITSVIVFAGLIIFNNFFSTTIFRETHFNYLIYISAFSVLVGSTNNIVAAPTKIQNESRIFITINILSPIIAYSVAIPLLLSGCYSFALQISNLIASLLVEIFFVYRNKTWFSVYNINKKYVLPLLKIAIPLMPSFLIYWVYNSSDRLMIQHFLSTSEVGLYAIGAKMGNLSNLIYTAFTGGWAYFAYSTMKEEKQVENYSRVYEYIGIISFSVSILACGFSYLIYKIVFTDEYLPGYKVAPYLFLAPLLQMLFQIAADQFLIMKKSWPSVLILFCGAVINVGCNFCLIPRIGIEGAAIGTLLGYIFANIICIVTLLKIKKIVIRVRFIISAITVLIYFIIWGFYLYRFIKMGILVSLILIIGYLYLYRNDIRQFFSIIKSRKEKVR